jgi:hypothetical protein
MITPTPHLIKGVPLVFLGLNGDADVGGWSAERYYACGSFASAVTGLDAALKRRNQNVTKDEIRILLLHHSIEYDGKLVQRKPTRRFPVHFTAGLHHLTIDDASRAALTEVAPFV